MAEQGLFTAFMREHRHLSNHLATLPPVRELIRQAQTASTEVELDNLTGEALNARIQQAKPVPPTLEPLSRGRLAEGDGAWRLRADGARIPTTRIYLRRIIKGDQSLLLYWPDETDRDLTTVDQELIDRIGGYDQLAHLTDTQAAEYWDLNSTWHLQAVDDNGPWAIYTYVDLTAAEQTEAAEQQTLAAIFQERQARIEPIVDAIGEQVDNFFARTLTDHIRTLAKQRKRVLAEHQAIYSGLGLPADDPANPQPASADAKPLTTYTVEPEPQEQSAPSQPTFPDTAPVVAEAPADSTLAQAAHSTQRTSAPNPNHGSDKSGLSQGQKKALGWLTSLVLSAIIIPVALSLFGVMDIRLPGFSRPATGTKTPAQPTAQPTPQMLAANSPVKIRWTGRGDTIQISWSATDFAGLKGLSIYSVDVYGLAPVEHWYNVGYSQGQELRTTATTNPIAETNEYFRDKNEPTRVDKNETWRVCVTGQRKLLPGTNTPRPIAGSERCSDPFNIP